MESKLASLKVADLKQLLTAAGLPVSGNKPDLIQRLLENPAATASLGGGAPAVASPAPTPAAVAAPAPAAPSPAPVDASTPAPAPAPEAASNGQTTEAPQQSEEERRQALIAELEKRKARAAKFGQPLGEAERKLERAIKFGLDPEEEAGVAKLSKPLATREPKRRGEKGEKKEVEGKAAKEQETEEQKQARLAAVKAEKEKARKRAERFGLTNQEEGDEKRKKVKV